MTKAPPALMLLLCVVSSGCVARLPVVTRPAPIGRELIELERARADGLVTDAEAAIVRARVLENLARVDASPVERVSDIWMREAKRFESAAAPATRSTDASPREPRPDDADPSSVSPAADAPVPGAPR